MVDNRPPDQGPDQPPRVVRRIAVQMPVAEPRLVYGLLGVIVLIFLYSFSLSPVERNLFFSDWAKVNPAIRDGEYYRLFTSMFLHLNLTHILFNGYALYVLGRDVGRCSGPPGLR